jgi:hypothetical protein
MARTKKFFIWVSSGELTCITAAASAAGLPRSAWLRDQGLRAAKYSRTRPAPLPASPPASPSGRPPAKLTHFVPTHLTEQQFAALDEQARACELPISAFIRQVVMGFSPRVRQPLLRSAIAAVNRSGKELSKLVQQAGNGTLLTPDLMRAITGLRDELQALRDALLTADAAAGVKTD